MDRRTVTKEEQKVFVPLLLRLARFKRAARQHRLEKEAIPEAIRRAAEASGWRFN